jgi:hypothetical protein
MEKKASRVRKKKTAWLIIFYSVPSKPVSNRINIWRRLAKVGAVQLKGAVYILPHNEEHYEFCQWLMTQVSSMGGEGDFVITDKFEMLSYDEITSLFKNRREADYRKLEKRLNELEIKINSIKKGSKAKNIKTLEGRLNKIVKDFNDIKQIDLFPSKAASDIKNKLNSLQKEVKLVSKTAGIKRGVEERVSIAHRRTNDYQGRTWITRRNPFVDRMASAWLIRKFIDSNAIFRFIDEHEGVNVDKDAVTFDIKGGEITHIGDLCTYEVFVKSFGIKNKRVKDIAELVHQIDMKDEKYSTPEAGGTEEILLGIRKTGKNDTDILERGMDVFEMLYVSKT